MQPAVKIMPARRPRAIEMPMIAITLGPGDAATRKSAAHANAMFGQAAVMSVQIISMRNW
jgi:hypothetical protein